MECGLIATGRRYPSRLRPIHNVNLNKNVLYSYRHRHQYFKTELKFLFSVCLHGMASTANGTIQPMTGLTDEPKTCRFYITAPSNNQIQISCSVVNLQAPGIYNSYLSVRIDGISIPLKK
jgi:hypothetical protein